MEPLIFMLWMVLTVAVPLMLLTSAFVGYRRGSDVFVAICLFVFGIIVHVGLVAVTFWFMFILIYAGAHTDPPGNALSWFGRIVWLGAEVLYAVIWISVSSLIAGRERPWPLRVPELT